MKKEHSHFVGIDISKETFDVALIGKEDVDSIESSVFGNTTQGINQMRHWLKQHQVKLQEALFCMEHTGIYCLPLANFLTQNSCHVWLEMPVAIIRSIGLQRGKNDRVDAKRIAVYCYKNHQDAKLWVPPRKVLTMLRNLLGVRERLLKAKKSLNQYIKELGQLGLRAQANEMLQETLNTNTALDRDLSGVDRKIDQLIREDAQLSNLFDLIVSVPGVGRITACYLLCFTNEFTMYTSAKQLACYCGVAPFEHRSGSSVKGRTRVHNMANKTLKSLLHLGALSVIKKQPEFNKYYQRKIAEGKNKMLVINAVRNKLVHRIAAVVKRGEPYFELAA